jgi:alpha-beta hydrolase superfamily lysophospholipase
MSERSDVTFLVKSERCAGWLYLPPRRSRRGSCVVMAHGITGTKDFALPAYAERFSEAGHAVLTFDYRHFGSSQGEPRQLVDVGRQIEDIRAALDFARSRAEVDPERVLLWGTSLGAGHVVSVSASDQRLAAAIAQLPFLGVDPRHKSPRPLRVTLELVSRAIADAFGALFGHVPVMVPMLGLPGRFAVFTGDEDYKSMRELEARAPTWRNEMAARSLFSLLRYRPVKMAKRVAMPLLIAAADRDTATSARLIEEVAQRAPSSKLLHYPGSHFSAYVGSVFDQMMADETAFAAEHLA